MINTTITTTFERQRDRMVATQIEARGIRTPRTLAAMRAIPRERFLPDELAGSAYDDAPLPIDEGQTISQPFVVALMVDALQVGPRDRALEIGAGSGYAAAVLGELAEQVWAIERHQTLARAAAVRLRQLQCSNVHVLCADGTLGWPDEAPFDAILVSAGGPAVPGPLAQQLAIGGRLVMPVGESTGEQTLVRIRRIAEHAFEEDELGPVRFVPLVGGQGWAAGNARFDPRRAGAGIRLEPPARRRLAALVADRCEPFDSIDSFDPGPLLDRIGDARVVMLGEATHGSSEFMEMRARITRELVERLGFNLVLLEGDWCDVQAIDRHVRRRDRSYLRTPAFTRFPTWMWRNHEMRRFVDWLAEHDSRLAPEQRVSIHGLDLYGLRGSIESVIGYLRRVDPTAADVARSRYACFAPWEGDPITYGRAVAGGQVASCESEASATLAELIARRREYESRDGDDWFDTARHATVIRESERFYRAMHEGSAASWNLRDRHMFDTLESVMRFRGEDARAVIWAHNSHIGNAAATEMGRRGETNLGELVRRHFGEDAYSIGFGTHRGTVAAASDWGAAMRLMSVRPSHEDSYERICHESEVRAFTLPLRDVHEPIVRSALLPPRLQRAIGVIYRPETEMLSHYFEAVLPAQFDEYVWFEETTAIRPFEAHEVAGMPETYPFGL